MLNVLSGQLCELAARFFFVLFCFFIPLPVEELAMKAMQLTLPTGEHQKKKHQQQTSSHDSDKAW